jgi:hypothetical protein
LRSWRTLGEVFEATWPAHEGRCSTWPPAALCFVWPAATSQTVIPARSLVSAGRSVTTRRWDEDVQVEMLTEQVTELGPFDQPYAVVPGEPSAVVAEP